MRQFATIIFFILSCITTYQGLMAGFSISFQDQSLVYIFAIGMTMGIQLMLIVSVSAFKSGEHIKRALLTYILCAALSVTSSFYFWYKASVAPDYAGSVNHQAVATIEKNLYQAEQGLSSFQTILAELKDYSAQRAIDEETIGGTCGDGSGAKAGPRSRLRNEDALIFGDLEKALAPLLESMREEIAAYIKERKSITEEELPRLAKKYEEIRPRFEDLTNHPQIKRLEETISYRLQLHKDGWIERGRKYRCPDRILDRKINALLSMRLPQLPKVNFFNMQEDRVVFLHSANVLWSLVSDVLKSVSILDTADAKQGIKKRKDMLSGDSAPSEASAGIAVPFVMSILVDLLIFISAPPSSSSGKYFSWLKKKGLSKTHRRKLERFVDASVSQQISALRRFSWRIGNSAMVIIPTPPRTDEERHVAALMEAVAIDANKGLLARGPMIVREEHLPKEVLAAIQPQGGSVSLTGYRLAKGGYTKLLSLLANTSLEEKTD